MRHALLPAILLALPALAAAQAPESIWYIRSDSASIASFEAHAKQIAIIAPQVFSIDSAGALRGGINPRIVAIARANGVKIHALVLNPGFDLGALHRILVVPDARAAAMRSLTAICRDHHVDGVQLDFENLHVNDRDAFTAFAREAADSVHRAGCQLSAAVVPYTGQPAGPLPYHRYMYDYWRGAYDFKALADTLDFLSYMTYAQHGGNSTPGPVAGFPWLKASLDYVLALGVPPAKISLGIPAYSDYWFTGYDARNGARPRGNDIGYPALMKIMHDAGATPTWDKTQKAWFGMWERDGVFEHAWLEDARAFKAKLALVHQHALRGYSVWIIGSEDPKTWRVVAPARR